MPHLPMCQVSSPTPTPTPLTPSYVPPYTADSVDYPSSTSRSVEDTPTHPQPLHQEMPSSILCDEDPPEYLSPCRWQTGPRRANPYNDSRAVKY